MAAQTEVKIFTMRAQYDGVNKFGIKFDLFHCSSVFFQTLPKIAKICLKISKRIIFVSNVLEIKTVDLYYQVCSAW